MNEVNGSRRKKIGTRDGVSNECDAVRAHRLRRRGALLALLGLLVTIGCASTRHPAPPAAVFPSGAAFRLELAADAESRRVGYMFREYVAADEGMLFLFESAQPYPFWMKNCRVNLDIIWLDDAYRVVEIAHDVAPCPAEGDCPNVFPMRSASYVLEVAGGTARREGLDRGALVTVYLEEPQGK